MTKDTQQSPELSPLEARVLKLVEEAPRQYRAVCETLKSNESETARALSRLKMLGLVHQAGPWYRHGPDPRETTPQPDSQ